MLQQYGSLTQRWCSTARAHLGKPHVLIATTEQVVQPVVDTARVHVQNVLLGKPAQNREQRRLQRQQESDLNTQ